MFPKISRLESQANLDLMRRYACHVCGVTPVDVHHIKTVGSGGGDELYNLISLCRVCHTKVHQMGTKTFFKKYRDAIIWFRQRKKLPPAKLP